MKFEFVREVSEPVATYGGNVVMTGDVIELDGHLAGKAMVNPDYRMVEPDTQPEGQFEDSPEFTLVQLRAQWQDKFGAKPHHKKSAETLRKELSDGNEG